MNDELSQIPYVFIRKRRKNEKIKEWILDMKKNYDEYERDISDLKKALLVQFSKIVGVFKKKGRKQNAKTNYR